MYKFNIKREEFQIFVYQTNKIGWYHHQRLP